MTRNKSITGNINGAQFSLYSLIIIFIRIFHIEFQYFPVTIFIIFMVVVKSHFIMQ